LWDEEEDEIIDDLKKNPFIDKKESNEEFERNDYEYNNKLEENKQKVL